MISLQWKCDVTKVGDICNKASQGKGNSPHGVKGKERPITARNNSRLAFASVLKVDWANTKSGKTLTTELSDGKMDQIKILKQN